MKKEQKQENEVIYDIPWSNGYKFSSLGHVINNKGKILLPQRGSKAILIYFSKEKIEELQPKHPFKACSLRTLYQEFQPENYLYDTYKVEKEYPSPWLFCSKKIDELIEKRWKEWYAINKKQWIYAFQKFEVEILGQNFKKYFYEKHPELLELAIERENENKIEVINDYNRIKAENKIKRTELLKSIRLQKKNQSK